MGLLDFLFSRSNNSQKRNNVTNTSNNDSYGRGYDDGYDDCCMNHDDDCCMNYENSDEEYEGDCDCEY